MQAADQPLLTTKGLTRRFGGLVAVSNLDFEIRPREILGLIGPNGAGKSTTFNLISGFYKPTAGELFVFGRNCTGKSPLAISRMGLVRTFQHGSLMRSMSVRDNILLGTIHGVGRGARRRERVAETAEMLGLTPYLADEAGTLPHGLQRLVSIGIAFAARPRLLCLDEPLTGLNQTEVANTLTVLQRIRDEFGCSVLLVEHNMKAVMSVCDRIVVLHHGQHLATGTPTEIRANGNVIDAYLGHRHGH
ncbi:ABC transporter ATP-binding protein [Bosea lathyri]|jgi:branched-chain amino acid transport system ATP-binding protein|uniref:Amino acid/amide ABC transporter ATP-binding protein 1, HAAT family n=1 Tax=Bosea lathyri TaxID=1036778 RepID=A0A1H5ZSW0_9HYPH|nr:ABC transporter ATP-binding protein [Bosea lathyri]SEG39568.1 amino acid/amide ABC transporter ATP-binding protein 1, HAAT family [Bosea lathyri]